MPTDTAPFDVTARAAAPVPVITSGAEATRAAEVMRSIASVDPAVARVCKGHFILVDALTPLGPPGQRLNDVLPPNHGQI